MDITYQWIRSRRKTIAIQIDREGQVIVRTPYGITKRQVEEFLDEKKDWILQTRQRVEKRKTEQIPISEEVRREGIERENGFFRSGRRILQSGWVWIMAGSRSGNRRHAGEAAAARAI